MTDDIKTVSGQFLVSAGHSHPESLADGRTVAPGDLVENVPEADRRLIDEGILIEVHEPENEDAPTIATEAAGKRADELGIDINDVQGTGQDGRITVEDVERAADDDDEEDDNG